ncbi:MAG: signal peptide peptidase SppA [Candidatus Micrarchaeia archaeon]
MRFKSTSPQNVNWLKYGGIILIGFVFLVFLGILLFSSISMPIFGKCVAVVNIDSEISSRSTPQSLFADSIPGSEEIAKSIEELDSRDDVASVLLVVDSPGGSVVGSQEIYRAVKNLDKPKVAYFRESAASGAYYISTGTDYIISEPSALTGSIGVIMTLADLSGLFEKIGYNMTDVISGESKDMGTPSRPLTQKERAILQSLVDEIFQDFRSVVVQNRGSRLNMQKFEEILDGRVVSGKQAKEIGLVDALGSKEDAIMQAAQLGNITDSEPRLCVVSPSSGSQGLFGMNSLLRGLVFGEAQKKVSIRYE